MLNGVSRLGVLCTLALMGSAASGESAQTGEKWQVSSSVEAMGMKMPARTVEVCNAKNSGDAPVAADSNCVVLDRKHVGNQEEVHMHCTGKTAAETTDATMHIEHIAPDHYRGKMELSSGGGQMTMLSEGQRLPGTCDPEAQKRAMEAAAAAVDKQMQGAQAQTNAILATSRANQSKMCQDQAARGSIDVFIANGSSAPTCSDPKDVKTICGNVQEHDGFGSVARRQRAASGVPKAPDIMAGAVKLCGFDVKQTRERLCSTAEQMNKLIFLRDECPALTAAVEQRECAGRKFTSDVAPKYRNFCADQMAQAAGSTDEAASAVQPSRADDAKEKLQKAKDKLKGLLHF